MAVESARVSSRLPPRNFDRMTVPASHQRARTWFRVHQSRFSALHFSLNSIHRFSHDDCPCPFLYLAEDVETCLFEAFGDKTYEQQKIIPRSLWKVNCVTGVRVPKLQLCDLTKRETLRVLFRSVRALMNNDLAAPQAWGLAIQKHPAAFQAITFKSRFNGKSCLALFRRDGIDKQLSEVRFGSLMKNGPAVNWLDKHKVSLF